MNILVLAPHPDDEIIGCGGSLALSAASGAQITVVYVTGGEAGGGPFTPEQLLVLRKQEATAGARLLGVTETIFLKNPDGKLQYSSSVVREVLELLHRCTPSYVYLPHEYDAHADHKATHAIGMEAARKYREKASTESFTIYGYEVWTPLSQYDVVTDITSTIETKLAALREHTTQLTNLPYDAAIQGLNRYRGAMTGVGMYAECFMRYTITS